MNFFLLKGGYDLDAMLNSIASYGEMNPATPFQGYDVSYDASSYSYQKYDSHTDSFGPFSFNWFSGGNYTVNSISLSSDVGSLNFNETDSQQNNGYDFHTPWSDSYAGHSSETVTSVLSESFATPTPPQAFIFDAHGAGFESSPSTAPNNFLWAFDHKTVTDDYSGQQALGSSSFQDHLHIDDQLLAVEFGRSGFQLVQAHTVTDILSSSSHQDGGLDTSDYHSIVMTDTHIVGQDHHLFV